MSDNYFNQRSRGFTLLEMLVAMSVFSIVVLIVMTTLTSIVNLQKKIIAIQTAQDNLRYAFESMTKEIRTGRYFYCGDTVSDIPSSSTGVKDCNFSNGGESFSFRNSVGQYVTYQINNGQLVKSSDSSQAVRPCTTGTYINCQRITSQSVVIVNKVNFYVSGSGANDGAQSMATIVLEGQVQDPVHNIGTAKLNLQATISKRGLLDRP